MRTRRIRWIVPLVVLALLAGCGGGGGGDGSSSDSSPASAVTEPEPVTESSREVPPAPEGTVVDLQPIDVAAVVPDESGGLVVAGTLLVILEPGAGAQRADEIASEVGGSVVGRIELSNLWQLAVPAPTAAELTVLVDRVAALDGVEVAFPDEIWTPDQAAGTEVWGVPISPIGGDPVYAGATGDGYRMIGVERAWTYLRGSGLALNDVKVGVIDDGYWNPGGERSETDEIDLEGDTHAAQGNISYWDKTTNQQVQVGPNPKGSHATGVVNLIGADVNDGGIAGIAGVLGKKLTISSSNVHADVPPAQASILVTQTAADPNDPAVVTIPNGLSGTSPAMRAIIAQVTARPPAKVINISQGRTNGATGSATAWRIFLAKVAEQYPGTLFVCSAGNNNLEVNGARRYPSGAGGNNVITVGNVLNNGDKAPSSNMASANYEITLAAPGDEAVQAVDANGQIVDDDYPYGNGYHEKGGTSMAAPQVAATAALLAAIKPDITAAEMKQIIAASARTTITVDGVDKPVPASVGGKVVAVDRAVFELIKQERAKRGLQPAELTPEYLERLGTMKAVAVSTDDPLTWNVRGIVEACDPPCTSVAISVAGDGYSIGGDTTQALAAPGEATWSVTVSAYPATIIVRRTDNQAGSRIVIDRTTLDGHWTGTASLDYFTGPGISLNQPVAVWATFDLQIVTDATGGITASGTAGNSMEGVSTQQVSGPLTLAGDQVTWSIDGATFQGTLSRPDATSARITGTWSGVRGQATSGGTWTLTKVG